MTNLVNRKTKMFDRYFEQTNPHRHTVSMRDPISVSMKKYFPIDDSLLFDIAKEIDEVEKTLNRQDCVVSKVLTVAPGECFNAGNELIFGIELNTSISHALTAILGEDLVVIHRDPKEHIDGNKRHIFEYTLKKPDFKHQRNVVSFPNPLNTGFGDREMYAPSLRSVGMVNPFFFQFHVKRIHLQPE